MILFWGIKQLQTLYVRLRKLYALPPAEVSGYLRIAGVRKQESIIPIPMPPHSRRHKPPIAEDHYESPLRIDRRD